jgi:hypothetical protein
MRKISLAVLLIIVASSLGSISCHRHVGHHFYPSSPRFEPTFPGDVHLLRREPRRSHIQLGEIWIRPNPRMSRHYVENKLREKAAHMGADALVITVDRYFGDRVVVRRYWRGSMVYQERLIVGVAVRYR